MTAVATTESGARLDVLDGATLRTTLRLDADVVIVGSGPAGAAVARTAARAGASVLVVEEGRLFRPPDFAADGFAAMSMLYRDLGAVMALGRAPMPLILGSAVGGTSVVNGAISWRLPRDIYDAWVASDPTLGEALPWDELDGITDEIEQLLHIAPTSADLAGPHNLLLARGAEALGLEHRPIARNVHGCRGLGRCLQGCPEGHKLSMDRSYLPDACSHGARILSSTRALRIDHARGRAVGVTAKALGGGRVALRARSAVVLAAGAIHTPYLLLRSRLGQGPVGKGLQCHPGVPVTGEFAEPVSTWRGATQGHEVIGLRREGLKFEALGYDLSLVAMRLPGVGRHLAAAVARMRHFTQWGAAVRAQASGRVRATPFGPLVTYSLTRADLLRVRRGVRVLCDLLLAAGATAAFPGMHGFDQRVVDHAQAARVESDGPLDPRCYTMAATHLFSTCRMGSDPRSSVVRPDFRHHRVGGLYIADSSVFPSNTGVNPQTSILALATLCGRRVVEAAPV